MDSLSKTDLRLHYKNELIKLVSRDTFPKDKVLSFIVRIRQFSEIDGDFSPVLKFFCDWALHIKKDLHLNNLYKDNGKTEELLKKIFEKFLVTNVDNNHDRFLLLIKPFMLELIKFFLKEKIPYIHVIKNYNIFCHRVGELISYKSVFINENSSLQISPMKGCTCFKIEYQVICSQCKIKGCKHSTALKN